MLMHDLFAVANLLVIIYF